MHPDGGGSGSPPSPAAAPQITSNLGDTVATNGHLLLFTHHIIIIITNISLEEVLVNTPCPNVKGQCQVSL